jgi:hypothetical protein
VLGDTYFWVKALFLTNKQTKNKETKHTPTFNKQTNKQTKKNKETKRLSKY